MIEIIIVLIETICYNLRLQYNWSTRQYGICCTSQTTDLITKHVIAGLFGYLYTVFSQVGDRDIFCVRTSVITALLQYCCSDTAYRNKHVSTTRAYCQCLHLLTIWYYGLGKLRCCFCIYVLAAEWFTTMNRRVLELSDVNWGCCHISETA